MLLQQLGDCRPSNKDQKTGTARGDGSIFCPRCHSYGRVLFIAWAKRHSKGHGGPQSSQRLSCSCSAATAVQQPTREPHSPFVHPARQNSRRVRRLASPASGAWLMQCRWEASRTPPSIPRLRSFASKCMAVKQWSVDVRMSCTLVADNPLNHCVRQAVRHHQVHVTQAKG